MADSYTRLIDDALGHVALEAPHAYGVLASAMADQRVDITIDGERCRVTSDPFPHVDRLGDRRPAHVDVTVSAATIAEIIDGQLDLTQATTTDRLVVHGTLDAIAATHDALLAFVHGAIRSPSVPGLRPRFETLRRRCTR